MITTAFVKVWDETIGAVAWNPETGVASFEFEPKFLSKKWDIAPLKMSIAKCILFPGTTGCENIQRTSGLVGGCTTR